MAKKTIVGALQNVFFQNFILKAVSAVIGAATAYLVDRGLLDGAGADALANALLQIANGTINLLI